MRNTFVKRCHVHLYIIAIDGDVLGKGVLPEFRISAGSRSVADQSPRALLPDI